MTTNNRKKVILHVIGSLSNGGTEKYLINLLTYTCTSYKNIVMYQGNENVWEKELKEMGIETIRIKDGSLEILTAVYKIARSKKIDIVYSYIYRRSLYVVLAAFMAGVKKRIVHAHRIDSSSRKKRNKLSILCIKFITSIFTTHCLACSKEAAKSLFVMRKVNIIRNGVNLNDYVFNNKSRSKIRKQLDINNSQVVIGTVGRLDKNKNQKFILDVLHALKKKDGNKYKLIVVGDGEQMAFLKDKATKMGLGKDVFLVGNKQNGNEYYNAFDVFLLTSLKEGFPFVLIEAQANGIPCFVSDSISRSTNISSTVKYLSLESGANHWANLIDNNNLTRNKIPHENFTSYSFKEAFRPVLEIYNKETS